MCRGECGAEEASPTCHHHCVSLSWSPDYVWCSSEIVQLCFACLDLDSSLQFFDFHLTCLAPSPTVAAGDAQCIFLLRKGYRAWNTSFFFLVQKRDGQNFRGEDRSVYMMMNGAAARNIFVLSHDADPWGHPINLICNRSRTDKQKYVK